MCVSVYVCMYVMVWYGMVWYGMHACMYVYIYICVCVCVYCNCPSSKYVTIDLIQKDIPKDHHIAAL